jgi:3-hydroxyacyl-[acyl-carrier-protein] dehydratase
VPRRFDRDQPETGAAPDSGLSHHEIAALLPHRYPFQLVDRVIEFVDGSRIVAVKNVSLGDPFLRGHFPDNPLMPGVLICEALAQAAALLACRSTNGVPADRAVVLTGLDGVRFRRPVVPGDQLRLDVTLTRSHRPLWRFQGTAWVAGQLVAEAQILATEVPRSAKA